MSHHEQIAALAERLQRAEAAYDCHGGPGTTTPACGACVTCLMRERGPWMSKAEVNDLTRGCLDLDEEDKAHG